MKNQDIERILAGIKARDRSIHYGNLATVDGPKDKLRFSNSAAGTDFYLYNAIGGYDGIQAIDVADALGTLTGDVLLHINSVGGSIFEGSAIYNLFNNYKKGTVNTVIDGVAASAASFIAMSGVVVEIEKNASMMLHDGSGGVIGTPKDMREQADVLDMLSDSIAQVYSDKAGGTPASWRKIMQTGDKWYNAPEAVKAKLADRIAGTVEASNALDLSLLTPTPTSGGDQQYPSTDVVGIYNALKGAFT
jgi:ATP-dependent protease ClpP protease subunit